MMVAIAPVLAALPPLCFRWGTCGTCTLASQGCGPVDDGAAVRGAIVHALRVVDTMLTTDAVVTLGAGGGVAARHL